MSRNVKCDVEIRVHGVTGSGKTELLNAINDTVCNYLGDAYIKGTFKQYEGIGNEQVWFRVDGELPKPKAVIKQEADDFFGAAKSWWNMMKKADRQPEGLAETVLSIMAQDVEKKEATVNIELPPAPKTMLVRINEKTGQMFAYRPGQVMAENDRIVKLAFEPVGNDKVDPLPTPSQDDCAASGPHQRQRAAP